MYYLESGQEKNRRMRNALLLACAAHVVLVAAISFDFNTGATYGPQIEVTLATRPASQAPDEARHIAQSSQEGSVEEAQAQPESNVPLPLENPADSTPLQDAKTGQARDADLLSTAAAAPRAVNDERAEQQQRPDEQARALPDQPRVRRLAPVATRESADAAYLHSFLKRLEAVGNKYYPEASVRYGLYGSLRLLVAVRSDGGLEEIRVLESSGYAVLDEAAIKTVRMAAPFAPSPLQSPTRLFSNSNIRVNKKVT